MGLDRLETAFSYSVEFALQRTVRTLLNSARLNYRLLFFFLGLYDDNDSHGFELGWVCGAVGQFCFVV